MRGGRRAGGERRAMNFAAVDAMMTWRWLCRLRRHERVLETFVSLGSQTVHAFLMIREGSVDPVVLLLEKIQEFYNKNTNLMNFDVGAVLLLPTSNRATVGVVAIAQRGGESAGMFLLSK